MLTVCTWLWGEKFCDDDVAILAAGVRRHLKQEYRFLLFSDRPCEINGVSDRPIYFLDREALLKVRGCFCRLRMFDPQWQSRHQIDDRLVCIDLDTVITGPLDPLFDRPEPFVIMQKGNATNPCPYNGALMMIRAGAHPEVWDDFSLEAAGRIPYFSFPDDQAWLAHKVPDAAGWETGPEHGVYVYQKPGWPGGKTATGLPEGARLVTFINRSPRELMHLGWIKEHWRA